MSELLYYATREIWVRIAGGHVAPLSLPGYGESREAAQRDAAYRAERYPQADEEERKQLLASPYRLAP